MLSNATAVATVAAPAVRPETTLIEKIAPTELSADLLSWQPTDFDKSKGQTHCLFLAKPNEMCLSTMPNLDRPLPQFIHVNP